MFGMTNKSSEKKKDPLTKRIEELEKENKEESKLLQIAILELENVVLKTLNTIFGQLK